MGVQLIELRTGGETDADRIQNVSQAIVGVSLEETLRGSGRFRGVSGQREIDQHFHRGWICNGVVLVRVVEIRGLGHRPTSKLEAPGEGRPELAFPVPRQIRALQYLSL